MEAWSLFGLSEHLERLSKTGDPLEVLEATVDFEHFCTRRWKSRPCSGGIMLLRGGAKTGHL